MHSFVVTAFSNKMLYCLLFCPRRHCTNFLCSHLVQQLLLVPFVSDCTAVAPGYQLCSHIFCEPSCHTQICFTCSRRHNTTGFASVQFMSSLIPLHLQSCLQAVDMVLCFDLCPNCSSCALFAGFVALLRGAGEREQAAKQDARHWQTQAAEWQQK